MKVLTVENNVEGLDEIEGILLSDSSYHLPTNLIEAFIEIEKELSLEHGYYCTGITITPQNRITDSYEYPNELSCMKGAVMVNFTAVKSGKPTSLSEKLKYLEKYPEKRHHSDTRPSEYYEELLLNIDKLSVADRTSLINLIKKSLDKKG